MNYVTEVNLLLCLSVKSWQLTYNAALNKPAYQISVHPGPPPYRARLANDGNRRTDLWHLSCAHTGNETNPWWAVDLGRPTTVYRVDFTNRGDCCGMYINFNTRMFCLMFALLTVGT